MKGVCTSGRQEEKEMEEDYHIPRYSPRFSSAFDYSGAGQPSTGHHLQQIVCTDRDCPPFHSVTMPTDHRPWINGLNPIDHRSVESANYFGSPNFGLTRNPGCHIPWEEMSFPHHHPHQPPIASPIPADPNIKMTLANKELWQQFAPYEIEMIITKSGRCMFPVINARLTGLDPMTRYEIFIDMMQVGETRYKYHQDKWVPSGKAEPHNPTNYVHSDSPATGAQYMAQPVNCKTLKLTNSNNTAGADKLTRQHLITLSSMHKYVPRFHVVALDDRSEIKRIKTYNVFDLREATFIAVTAYQNQQVTKLKIELNQYAKGFRDKAETKRRADSNSADDSEDAGSGSKRSRGDRCSGQSSIGSPMLEDEIIDVGSDNPSSNSEPPSPASSECLDLRVPVTKPMPRKPVNATWPSNSPPATPPSNSTPPISPFNSTSTSPHWQFQHQPAPPTLLLGNQHYPVGPTSLAGPSGFNRNPCPPSFPRPLAAFGEDSRPSGATFPAFLAPAVICVHLMNQQHGPPVPNPLPVQPMNLQNRPPPMYDAQQYRFSYFLQPVPTPEQMAGIMRASANDDRMRLMEATLASTRCDDGRGVHPPYGFPPTSGDLFGRHYPPPVVADRNAGSPYVGEGGQPLSPGMPEQAST